MALTTESQLHADATFASLAVDSLAFKTLLRLCHVAHISAGELANHWDAYSLKHSVQTILPNDDLAGFERFLDAALAQQRFRTPAKQFLQRKPGSATNTNFDKDSIHMLDAEDFLQPSPVTQQRAKRASFDFRTPDIKKQRGTGAFSESPGIAPSPASQVSYAKRTNAGHVELVLNEPAPKAMTVPKRNASDVEITVYNNAQMEPYRYMFEKLHDKADALDDRLGLLGRTLAKREGVEELAHVKMPRQDTVHTIGRICCDGEGKLNGQSVLLEGTREGSQGERVNLDLSELETFSLFPGQIVLAEGLNPEGHRLLVKKISQSARRNPATTPASQLVMYSEKGGLRIMAAAGPYTFSDDLSFTPLDNLLEVVVRDAPDVLILMGPFVDADHSMIKRPSGDLCKTSFQELFDMCLADRLQSILDQTHALQIVVVPALSDVHHDPIFPQPPLLFNFRNERLHSCANPCTLKINEVCVGITTADILFHINTQEIARVPPGGDRMGRLVNHLIEQRSYYPLYPPGSNGAGEDMNIDYLHMEQFDMPVTPDILLLPSQLKYFAKEVQNCVIVNPGKLTKSQAGGTFANFTIHAHRRNEIPVSGDKPTRHSVPQRTRTEIVRI